MKTFYLIYLLGIFLPSNSKRIVNGEDAVLGQFPYQVLWAMESDGDFYVNCGGSIYNKFSLELRYPITLGEQAKIYGLSFLEGGASFNDFRDYTPFTLQRSAGFGLRIFMPAFGLLGIDFGHGFDPIPGTLEKNGWETHFIIGQQF